MKTIKRLQQLRLAKKILESNGYQVQRLNEGFPPFIQKFIYKNDMRILKSHMLRQGFDIQSSDLKLTQIKNNRDPILKAPDTYVIFIRRDPQGNGWYTAVTYNKKFVINSDIFKVYGTSWNDLIADSKYIFTMSVTPEITQAYKDKRLARSTAKAGALALTRNPTSFRGKLDKSGYVIDTSRLIKKLAELKLKNSAKVLADTKAIMTELVANIDELEDVGSMGNDVSTMLSNLSHLYTSLKKELAEYEKFAGDEFSQEFVKNHLLRTVADIGEYKKKAEKLLSKVRKM